MFFQARDIDSSNKSRNLDKALIFLPKNTTALTIQKCNSLDVKRDSLLFMTQLKTLDIRNIRHLSVQKYGLSVRQTVPLRITISDSSCHNSLPKFSGQNSYENVELYNVKVHLNCSCQKDLTHYHCQTLNTTTGKTEFQKYEDFDESYCDHENHHHSIFDEILEELPDDKYVLIGIKK